ncbi:MAG: sugar phosphate isomerase/epimerase, partial [Lachnospiraceae bacterium]|nr:sugar phosphate isomerase/epimerase [Lachnospiraceae bacterium]
SADGINIADFSMEEAKKVKERLDAQGVKVSALGSPIGKIGVTDEFESHFEKYKHVVELAKVFETPYIRMFSFYLPEGGRKEDYREIVFERIEQMVDYAAKNDIVLLHENEKGIYGDQAPRCLELMKRFYGEHFQCTFDFANFVQCDQDTMEAYELLKPYIKYLHIKDALWESKEVVPAGEGDGHVAKILGLLDKNGYEGFLSLEPHLFQFKGLEKLEKNAKSHVGMNSITVQSKGAAAYQYVFKKFEKILSLIS